MCTNLMSRLWLSALMNNEISFETISRLKCQRCFRQMRPPVRGCPGGHGFCGKCRRRISNCTVCNASPCNTPIIELDQLYSSAKRPCKYQPYGCRVKDLVPHLRHHEENCSFGKYHCIMCRGWRWHGPVRSMAKHFEDSHKIETYAINTGIYRVDLKASAAERVHVYTTGDDYFLVKWWYRSATGLVKWIVRHIAEEGGTSYLFNVSFLETATKTPLMISPCFAIERRDQVDNLALMAHKDMLKHYSNDWILRFRLSIYPNCDPCSLHPPNLSSGS